MPFDPQELKKFTDTGRAISRAAQIGFEQWAEGEAGLILKGWAGLISVSTVTKAETRQRNRVLKKLGLTKGPTTINSGVRGPQGITYVKLDSGKFMAAGRVGHNANGYTPFPRRLSKKLVNNAAAAASSYEGQSALVAIGKRTIGLARQSVVQIGDMLGIALEAVKGPGLSAASVQQARNAVAGDGKTYQNGFGERSKAGGQFSITLINRYPFLSQAHIDTALAEVVLERQVAMTLALQGDLFRHTAEAAKQFPYLEVKK